MIKVEKFQVNMIQENCYIVSDDTRECVIVDCGAYYPEEQTAIEEYISQNGLKPVGQWLTHAHFDHVLGVKFLYDKYGIRPTLCVKDEELYKGLNEQGKQLFGLELEFDMPPIERLVRDGDHVRFGESEFKVIETPGHTKGCVFYYSENDAVAFSGDTLFRGSIGRTDLPGGSMFQIIQSLRMIEQLPDNTKVYPGHGPSTTIGYECETNMYLDR